MTQTLEINVRQGKNPEKKSPSNPHTGPPPRSGGCEEVDLEEYVVAYLWKYVHQERRREFTGYATDMRECQSTDLAIPTPKPLSTSSREAASIDQSDGDFETLPGAVGIEIEDSTHFFCMLGLPTYWTYMAWIWELLEARIAKFSTRE